MSFISDHVACIERASTETHSFVFQMYRMWGRRLKRLNRTLKRFIKAEKENAETEFYEELLELRELAVPALKLYYRLMRQEFVRFTDEERLFDMMELAVKRFNAFVLEHAIAPVRDPDMTSSLMDINYNYF